MNKFVLSLGSNSEDREYQMDLAFRHLKSAFDGVESSAIYETDALNGKDAPYLNSVVVGFTNMEYNEMVECMKKWEKQCGRTSDSKHKGIIPIDIDVVVWNNTIVRDKDYNMPYFIRGYQELSTENN